MLTPASFLAANYDFDLYALQTMPFSAMIDTNQGAACGGYTYELEYLSTGPLFSGSAPSLTAYSIAATPSVTGTITDVSWLGIHPFRLKCTNGIYSAAAGSRGTNGLFTTVYSTQIDVTILDPCRSSVVNGDNGITSYTL